jgi:hypothetical protein
MSDHRLIDAYLTELAGALQLPRGRRRRVLAEAIDHLLCATEGRLDAGEEPDAAQRGAIDAFGPVLVVALAHERAAALDAARPLGPAIAVLLAVFAVLVAVAQGQPSLASGLAGAIAVLAVQVAAVCGVLTVVRLWRHRRDAGVPGGKLRLIGRGALIAVASIGAAVVAIAVAVVSGDEPAGAPLVVALFASAAVTIAAGAITAATTRRAAVVTRRTDEPAPDDAWDDLAALAGWLPVTGLQRHPWRVACATALAAGLAAALGHLAAEGPPADGAGDLVAVTAVLVALEGAAVLGCFVLLGRFLGLRRA